ncbi:MAG: hypothetical protein WCG29_05085 [Desulfomonile sp.]|jgi:hypothetical protein
MKYLVVIAIALAAWSLLEEFVFKDKRAGSFKSLTHRFLDIGRRLHRMIGVLALIIIMIFLIRMILYAAHVW